jgi:hypothetical protein
MAHAEQRAAFRFATDLDADVRMAGQFWTARLHNISTTGCMIACPEGGLPDGWLMRLWIGDLPVTDAEVIWRHRGHAGLRFLMPLQSTALEHLGYCLPESGSSARAPAGLHAHLVKRGLGVPDDTGVAA